MRRRFARSVSVHSASRCGSLNSGTIVVAAAGEAIAIVLRGITRRVPVARVRSAQLRHGAMPLACARSAVAIVRSSARKPTLLPHWTHVSFSKNSVLPHVSQLKVRIGGSPWEVEAVLQDVCHELRLGRAVPLRLGLYSADNNSEPKKRPVMARVGCFKLSWVLLVALRRMRQRSGAPDGEWRTYGGDLGHTRYAPLDQIDASNFNRLEIAWRFKTDSLGPEPRVQLPIDAADGRRRRLLDGGLAPRRRRARRRQRRAALDPSARRRRARPGRAAAALGPRPRVLGERRRQTHHLRDAGLSNDRARRAHRRSRRELR